jgi:hypothetical protein
MWYLLKVDVLVGVFVFASASLAILALFAWQEAKTFATAVDRALRNSTSAHGRRKTVGKLGRKETAA